MKPKSHLALHPKFRREERISRCKTLPSIFWKSVAAAGLVGLSATDGSAQVTYTIVPSATQLDWNTAASWTSDPAATYPGSTAFVPETPTLIDTAIVSGAFGGVAQTVDLSSPLLGRLAAVTLGDSSGTGVTTIQSINASNLLFNGGATITTAGTPGAVNAISAPVTLVGNLTVGALFDTSVTPAVLLAANDLAISGKITPAAAGNRMITNSSSKALTFGDIDISTADATGILTFRNENTFASNRINLHGVIANGSSVAAGLIFEGRINNTVFEIGNNVLENTYTGTTVLQGNGGGGRPAIFLINSAQPFGPSTAGRLTLGGASNSTAVIEAINGNRTIPNLNVTFSRNSTFQGSNSLTFTGTILAGTGSVVANNISGSGQLKFDGRYNLDNSNQTSSPSDSRSRPFGGTGVTVFNDFLADHALPSADMFGGIDLTGAGMIIINGTATYQGSTRITGAGTVQLGDGGTTGTLTPDFPNLSYDDAIVVAGVQNINDPLLFPDFVKKSVVTGGATGTGSFAVKRSDDLVLSQTLNGGIGLKHLGSGVLTVATPQFNSGANQVGDGITPSKLVVTAAASAEITKPGSFAGPQVHGAGFNNFYQIVTVPDLTGLSVGQSVYLGNASGAFYIHSLDGVEVDEETENDNPQITLMGTGITNAASGLIPGQNVSGPVVDQILKFGAGSSLGTSAASTTVRALSTLTGTGDISGSVIVEGILEPGMSIGTLSTGPLRFNSGSTLKVEINTTELTSDKVVVTGNVTGGGSPVLELTDLGADVALPVGTKFVLIDYSGSYSAAAVLTYLGNPVPDFSSITKGANTYHVNYADPTEGGTALTLTVGPPPAPVTAFETWIESYSNQLPVFLYGPTDDPDSDGRDNILEFALNGNPGSGTDQGKMVVSTEDSGDEDTDRDLSVTLAVRNGAGAAVAGPGGSAVLTVDGIVYTIQGSQALLAWDSAVNEVIPASTLVPPPAEGWTARTFKVTDSNGLPDKRFIRVGVE